MNKSVLRAVSLLLVAAMGLSFTSCRKKKKTPAYGGSAIVGITEVPEQLDPHKATSVCEKEILVNIFEGLYKFNSDGEFIAYMQDEAGAAAFYRYDAESGQFVDYRTVDRTAERIYGLFFRIFMVISLIESLIIIGTVYLVRRIIANKNNPRPRRV